MQDPRGLERARVVYVTHEGKVLVHNEIFLSRKDLDGQFLEVSLPHTKRDRYGVFTTRPATLMRSHGAKDFPPSSIDMTGLLLSTTNPEAMSCVFVATTERKILVFRTRSTPQMSQQEANRYEASWNNDLNSRVKGGLGVLSTRNNDRQKGIQEELFDEKARELGLAVFVAPAEVQHAQRVNSLTTKQPSILKSVFGRLGK